MLGLQVQYPALGLQALQLTAPLLPARLLPHPGPARPPALGHCRPSKMVLVPAKQTDQRHRLVASPS
ncbi:hypothetical protein ARTHRO9V_90092 [Arthrobacter sp. 9V]|nr:hypothetical protein ARTHRO9V_90092 [Arthrobacter sp. 9V]